MTHVDILGPHRSKMNVDQRILFSQYLPDELRRYRSTTCSTTSCYESSATSFFADRNGLVLGCPRLVLPANHKHTRHIRGHISHLSNCKMTSDAEYNERWLKIWSNGLPAGQVDSSLSSICSLSIWTIRRLCHLIV